MDAMCIMKIGRLSMAEAENFVATLWCTLEEHGVSSPQLRVGRARGAVDLSVQFRSQKDSELIRRIMPSLAAATAGDQVVDS
jgi:hypothetical protein